MSCSVRISSGIFSNNVALKNKYLSHLLCSRYFSSKDNDVKDENSGVNDSASNEKSEKNAKEALPMSKTSRFKAKPVSDEMKEAGKQKLMSLLSEITITSDSPAKSATKLNIAKAVKRISKKERLKQMEAERMTPEKKMDIAIKAVASNFKKDSEKIESELTEKLSSLNLAKESSIEKIQDTEETLPLVDDKLSSNLMSSVEEVAATISENPIPPRSELTERLMRLSLNQKSEQKPVRSVIEGMVIKSQQPVSSPPAEEKETSVKRSVIEGMVTKSQQPVSSHPAEERIQVTTERKRAVKRLPKTKKIEKINLFGAPPLNIFEPGSENKPDLLNTFWQKLQEKELRLLTQFAPANAFEEMIMWTEQGKHWKLPIDNETEMGAEENVGFHEHVFLDQHLKGFPTKGPIRHFMELVCVALSQNPYITVERKIENIDWFRNYFKEKEEILRDAGAID